MRYLLILLCLFPFVSFADWDYCSMQGFCLKIPDTMMVINQENYKEYKDVLPKSIYQKFYLGSKREIITDKFSNVEQSNSSSFFIVEVSTPSMNHISTEGTCKDLKKIEGNNLKLCEHIFKYSIRNGMWALTFNPDEYSFTRIWINLDKKHHIFAVSAGKYEDEYIFRLQSAAMFKILKTIKK